MPELFCYISDTSSNYSDDVYTESYIDDDDTSNVITESDLALMEFDQYVQEGVGVKILVGIGIVAMLGGLIALIIKLFSGKSGGASASTKAKTAKAATTKAKEAGVKTVKVEIATGEETAAPKQVVSAAQSVDKAEKHVEEIVETVNQYNDFVEKYFDMLASEIEKLSDKYPLDNISERDEAKLKSEFMRIGLKIFDEAIDDFPIIKKLLGAKTKIGVKKKVNNLVMGDKTTAEDIAKKALKYVVSELDIDEVAKFVDSTMKQCKTLMFDGKKLSKNGERLKKILMKGNKDSKANKILSELTSEKFDELTAAVSLDINEAYEFVSQNMTEIVKSCKDALAVLEKGGNLNQALGGGSFESIGNKVNDRYGEDIENMRDAVSGMMGGRFR